MASSSTCSTTSAKAWRYVGEMEQIAATQAGVGLTPELFRAFAAIYAELADRAVAPAPEDVPDDVPLGYVLRRFSEGDEGPAGAGPLPRSA
jgi:Domain of unknown function (DUF1932)